MSTTTNSIPISMQHDKVLAIAQARAPSPWDKFAISQSVSPRPSPARSPLALPESHVPSSPVLLAVEMRAGDGIPALVPEIEQGNIEYKLKLLNPPQDRFNRLVTQLNWRLMEGSGEAYYQLGVADSGQLVGLTKSEMESTLETLEAMAGEIGASVFINREIEVSPRLLGLRAACTNGGNAWYKNRRATGSALDEPTPSSSEAEANNATTTDSNSEETDYDPDEIIVRSAPKPVTHAMLRRNGVGSASPSPMLGAQPDEDDGEDLGVFGLGDLGLALSTEIQTPASFSAKPVPIPQKRPKGRRPPNPFASPKSLEEIAEKSARKREKRDKRRAEKKLSGSLNRQDTLKPPTKSHHIPTADVVITDEPLSFDDESSTVKDDKTEVGTTVSEPRLIVEALIVRKAGFGKNNFVDLSEFEDELQFLPSFSLT